MISIPLNKRDFSQLLLLAAGTMTDTNGAANLTQQFAVNGQRGVEAVFAIDGADSSDPEMGGATFSNFNVDAVEAIQSSSGWMPAEIGRGAAGFTNILTRSGANNQPPERDHHHLVNGCVRLHGSVCEFLRNPALDARNFFDHRTPQNPGRIPPFRRNKFGFTLGGPLVRNQTAFFVEYQGFRQMLGTTQVLPVPTAQERHENSDTLRDVLKKGWGFKGLVLSDWGGTHSTEKASAAGLDQEQPLPDASAIPVASPASYVSTMESGAMTGSVRPGGALLPVVDSSRARILAAISSNGRVSKVGGSSAFGLAVRKFDRACS